MFLFSAKSEKNLYIFFMIMLHKNDNNTKKIVNDVKNKNEEV